MELKLLAKMFQVDLITMVDSIAGFLCISFAWRAPLLHFEVILREIEYLTHLNILCYFSGKCPNHYMRWFLTRRMNDGLLESFDIDRI